MLNITRAYSKCPSKKWISKCPDCITESGEPCGQGVVKNTSSCGQNNLKEGSRCPDSYSKGLTHWKDCMIPAEETRTSNPPCNLRGTGWNRWEWLCLDPQERVEIPFDYNIDNRIVVKDNHRPCIPTLWTLFQLYLSPKNYLVKLLKIHAGISLNLQVFIGEIHKRLIIIKYFYIN